MATRDFIINFFGDGPLFKQAIAGLKRPYLVWSPPRPPIPPGRKTGDWDAFLGQFGKKVINMWKNASRAYPGDTLGRIAVVGFSEGCSGVGAVLRCEDASAIDVVIPVDGVHCFYTGQRPDAPPPPLRAIDPALLWQYTAFARLAVRSGPPSRSPTGKAGKVLAITHSSIRPPYASTTETGLVIWNEAIKGIADADIEDASCDLCPAKLDEVDLSYVVWPNPDLPVGTQIPGGVIGPNGYCTKRPQTAETNFMPPATFCYRGFADGWSTRRVANGLSVFGWRWPTPNGTLDPSGNRDHVFQAQMVLPYMVQQYVVKRWNPTCSNFGVEQVDALRDGSCSLGAGEGYFEGGPPAPLDNPYPLGTGIPRLVDECPMPGPGEIIVGRPGNPCFKTLNGVAQSALEPSSLTPGKIVAGAAGLALGCLAYNAWRRSRR